LQARALISSRALISAGAIIAAFSSCAAIPLQADGNAPRAYVAQLVVNRI